MKENGRVIFNNQFMLADQVRATKEVTPYSNSMKGLWYDTVLSKSYFSKENIKYIIDNIRYRIFKITNNVVEAPDLDTLKNVMRSIFLKFSKNLKTNIKNQISDLDEIVIEFCVKEMSGSLTSYLKYIEDVSTMPVPLSKPNNTNIKGDKSLELRTFY